MPREDEIRRVTDELKERIRSGALSRGVELGTELELAERYDLDVRSTRLILAELASEGLVDYAPGRPVRVRDFPIFTLHASREQHGRRREDADSYHRAVMDQGRVPKSWSYVTKETAKAEVARRLRIPEGSIVAFRQMWRTIDGEHWSIETSYYPLELVKDTDLMKPEDIRRGTIEVLAEKGYEQVGYTDRISARAPTPEEAEYFQLDPLARPMTPVLELWRIAYSKERPIRVTQTVLPADRNHLFYETGNVEAYYADKIFPGSDLE